MGTQRRGVVLSQRSLTGPSWHSGRSEKFPCPRDSGLVSSQAPPPVGASNTPTPLRPSFRKYVLPWGRTGRGLDFFSWEEFRPWKPPHRRAGVGCAFDAPPPHRLRRARPAPGPRSAAYYAGLHFFRSERLELANSCLADRATTAIRSQGSRMRIRLVKQ